MVEIKQVDREALAVAYEAEGLPLGAEDIRSGCFEGVQITADLIALATQRETCEARIAELERERDAADLSRTAYARALEKMRIALVNVHDHIEDEGDRVYFGSTNHADDLKEAWHLADALQWEEVLADTQPKTDVVRANLHLQSELTTAEAKLSSYDGLVDALRLIASCRSHAKGDVVDIAADALKKAGA